MDCEQGSFSDLRGFHLEAFPMGKECWGMSFLLQRIERVCLGGAGQILTSFFEQIRSSHRQLKLKHIGTYNYRDIGLPGRQANF